MSAAGQARVSVTHYKTAPHRRHTTLHSTSTHPFTMSAEASSSTVQIVKPASMEQDKYDAIREYRQVGFWPSMEVTDADSAESRAT